MARLVNSFALLGDEEGDDLMALAANVAGKILPPAPVEKVLQPQPQKNPASPSEASGIGKFPTRPLPPPGSARVERGRGQNDRGHGLARIGPGRDEADRASGYYQKSASEFDAPKSNDSFHGRGRGRGRGRGHGQERGKFNEERSFRNDINQDFGGNENDNKRGLGDESSGLIEAQGGKVSGNELQPFRNENRSHQSGRWYAGGERGYNGERRGFRGREGRNYGGRDGPRFGRGEGQNESMKEESEEKQVQIGDSIDGTERDTPETMDVPKDADSKQVVSEGVSDQKVVEEEEKEMTLDEYEKLLSEKRKALEGLKSEERKVVLDKDFELMQLIDKKKANDIHFVKLKSEKDKLKKKDSIEKEEKIRKALNITEFLGPVAGGERSRGRGGRGRGRGGRGEWQGNSGFEAGTTGRFANLTEPEWHIEDSRHFPLLGAPVRAA